MALRREQSATGVNTSFASTVTATFSNTLQIGSLIILAWEGDSATATNKANTPTDTAGNTYVRAVSVVSSAVFDLEIWYAINQKAQASNAVTVTDSLAGVDSTLVIEEWTGADSVTVLDKSSSATGSSTALDSGNMVTLQPDLILWGAGAAAVGSSQLTVGAGYSNLTQTATTFSNIACESQVVAATGQYKATFGSASA